MASPLRKIREQLLAGSETSKFLLYVSGEIILVMIGILLAMQVNNWNEDRKARLEEKAFLKALRKEMADNLAQLNKTISYNERSRNAAYKLLEIYSRDYRSIATTVLDSLFAEVQWTWTFDPELSNLTSIKANGKIGIIQNPVIQSFVSSFEESTKDSEEESLITRSIITDKYVMLVSKYISESARAKYIGYPAPKSRFPSDYNGVFSDREVESTLSYIYVWRDSELEELRSLKKKLSENLALVDKEIE